MRLITTCIFLIVFVFKLSGYNIDPDTRPITYNNWQLFKIDNANDFYYWPFQLDIKKENDKDVISVHKIQTENEIQTIVSGIFSFELSDEDRKDIERFLSKDYEDARVTSLVPFYKKNIFPIFSFVPENDSVNISTSSMITDVGDYHFSFKLENNDANKLVALIKDDIVPFKFFLSGHTKIRSTLPQIKIEFELNQIEEYFEHNEFNGYTKQKADSIVHTLIHDEVLTFEIVNSDMTVESDQFSVLKEQLHTFVYNELFEVFDYQNDLHNSQSIMVSDKLEKFEKSQKIEFYFGLTEYFNYELQSAMQFNPSEFDNIYTEYRNEEEGVKSLLLDFDQRILSLAEEVSVSMIINKYKKNEIELAPRYYELDTINSLPLVFEIEQQVLGKPDVKIITKCILKKGKVILDTVNYFNVYERQRLPLLDNVEVTPITIVLSKNVNLSAIRRISISFNTLLNDKKVIKTVMLRNSDFKSKSMVVQEIIHDKDIENIEVTYKMTMNGEHKTKTQKLSKSNKILVIGK